MRMSDWSSDVCSSDLLRLLRRGTRSVKTVYSEKHKLHHAKLELMNGQMQPAVEMPSRAETVLERVKAVDMGPVVAPAEHGLEPVLKVHDAGYVRFLDRPWDLWTAEVRDHEARTSPGLTYRHKC